MIKSSYGSEAVAKGFRVAVVAPQMTNMHRLESLLSEGAHQVATFFSLTEINQRFQEQNFDILVFQLSSFDGNRLEWLQRVRARFAKLAVVVIAKEVEPNVRFVAHSVPRVRLLEWDYESRDLSQVIAKLMSSEKSQDPTAARMHARTERQGWAELSDLDGKIRVKAKFLDFAQMGARVLVDGDSIEPKSKWVLRYPSSTDPGKIQSLYCYVVWQSESPAGLIDSLFKPKQQVLGLRFVAAA